MKWSTWMVAAGLACATGGAEACSSCGCTLNSDWSSQGYTTHSGFNADLRYDYFDQTELRSGTHAANRAALTFPNDSEVQQDTLNRNTTVALDWSPSRTFGVNLQLPYFDRPHSTIAEGDTEISTSHSRGLGDARIVARYQGFEPDLSVGVQVGLKLATGRFDDTFRTGPQAGQIVDRGLQLGTGTTDLLLGAYTVGALSADVYYFANALWQVPLASRDGFRPGNGANVTAGLRYTGPLPGGIVPQLQLNARIEARESGANADVENSGATLVYLSPGVGFRISGRLDGFAFLQAPVYQRVNGLQLEPRLLGSVGFRYRF
ncbi:MAG: hypothetical protein JSR73_16500 [Proteobacteria bacterium]|nr:hypothetical protein [Pseudomonadota bacterium]